MHLVTIPNGISEPIPVAGGTPLEGGHTYLCTNAFTGSLLMSNWRVMVDGEMWALSPLVSAVRYRNEGLHEPCQDLDGMHIWLVRVGGYGALLMLTPVVRHMRAKWPKAVIHVARSDQYVGIFDGWGENIIEESLPIDVANGLDSPFQSTIVISFESWLEGHPNATKVHASQHFADKLDINLDGDHTPSFYPTELEAKMAEQEYPRGNRRRIGVQLRARTLHRSYPFMIEVIERLLAKDCEVLLFGAPGSISLPEGRFRPEEVINTTRPGMSFRRSASVLKTCDAVIAPDSCFVPLAAALDVPCVGLYAPFPANLRGSGKRMKGIQGVGECNPCFYAATHPADFPAGMPCSSTGKCEVVSSIEVEQVVKTALELASPLILPSRRIW
jgi:ADP-heptose:LPS heptosyltransferase